MLQPYPSADQKRYDKHVERDMVLLQQVIGAIRNIRGEMNVPPGKEADLVVRSADVQKVKVLKGNQIALQKLARITAIDYSGNRPKLAAGAVVQGVELFVPLAELIDVDVERNRLEKEINRLANQLEALAKKLSNQNFTSRAPQDVIDKELQKKNDWEINLQKLESGLENLSEH
jgi:valyl-tRNA synthetase